MTEFKFPCPQCKQYVQCDTNYVGTQINCPACQQAIIVPPVPASVALPDEPAVHIKKSSLKMAAGIALSVLLVAGLAATGFYLFAGLKKVTFKAYVDGTDVVKLSGGRLWIEHLDFQPANKITINGKKWNPVWDNNTSAPYSLGWGLIQRKPENIKLTKRLGRGTVEIMEKPSPANQETLSIKVDDGVYGGADWYEFTVTW